MRLSSGRLNERGVALAVVIIIIMILTMIGGYVANFHYSQRRLIDVNTGRSAEVYYYAQAGIVDANWRIRTNYLANYNNAATTANYSLDVDGDGVLDVNVSIGALGAVVAGQRRIQSTGIDHP